MGKKTVIAHSDAKAQGNPVQRRGCEKYGPTEKEKGSDSPDVKGGKGDYCHPVDSISLDDPFGAGVKLRIHSERMSAHIRALRRAAGTLRPAPSCRFVSAGVHLCRSALAVALSSCGHCCRCRLSLREARALRRPMIARRFP